MINVLHCHFCVSPINSSKSTPVKLNKQTTKGQLSVFLKSQLNGGRVGNGTRFSGLWKMLHLTSPGNLWTNRSFSDVKNNFESRQRGEGGWMPDTQVCESLQPDGEPRRSLTPAKACWIACARGGSLGQMSASLNEHPRASVVFTVFSVVTSSGVDFQVELYQAFLADTNRLL